MVDYIPDEPRSDDSPATDRRPWFLLLNRYHWFVLIVAAMGWLFDTMDQQLFVLTRRPSMQELIAFTPTTDAQAVVDASGQPNPAAEAHNAEVARRNEAERTRLVDFYSGIVTMIFMIGWATGGLVFGVLGDKFGRAKVMLWTIVAYSLCTGLSALSVSVWDFALYRFLTGLGVGGEFAVGVSLVAEVMPARARTYALGLLQALSTVGNATAAILQMGIGFVGLPEDVSAWRILFLIGTAPALLAVVIRFGLKEPEKWKAAVGEGQAGPGGSDASLPEETETRPVDTGVPPGGEFPGNSNPYASPQAVEASKSVVPHPPSDPAVTNRPARPAGSYAELFGDPRWRYNAIIGLILACVGIIGLWGIGFFAADLTRSVLKKQIVEQIEAEHPPGDARDAALRGVEPTVGYWVGMMALMQNAGAFFGIYGFGLVGQWLGRRPAFAISFVLAMGSTILFFYAFDDWSDVFWMPPLLGFCQLSLFGGYAIYFPELFPTRLRSTGVSFCYNVGRYVAAVGPFFLGFLASSVFQDTAEPFRWAGISMCSVFVIGLVTLIFAPETKGHPLPE